ncbi:hypothetical protein MNV49_004431 [Pseudohyphozyma bogoriensis]|nr:hypothetical protein MNV49_004431 [Pseudohyphozyma bogoriensis]
MPALSPSEITARQQLGRYSTLFDPVYAAFFNEHQAGRACAHQVPLEQSRANPALYAAPSAPMEAEPVKESEVWCAVTKPEGRIKVKIYKPLDEEAGGEPRPLYFHIHGGGFVVGQAGMDAPLLRTLVRELGIVVADVDYRLAPEFPAPTPLEDVWEAFAFILSQSTSLNISLSKIILGGISAGANLATILSLRLSLSPPPLLTTAPLLQLLIVPCVTACIFSPSGSLLPTAPTSWQELGDNPILGEDRMTWFYDCYIGEMGSERRKEWEGKWEVSPLEASGEVLRGAARAFVVTAEIDILRDEGKLYAEKLKENGVVVRYEEYKAVSHTFVSFTGLLDESRRLVKDILKEFRDVLAL